jgi:rhamnosyltransferase subunit B
MSRILVTTLGSLGDLHPYIALGLGLRDRGHEIVFVTIKDYQAAIEAVGFEFQPLGEELMNVADPEMVAMMMDRQNGTERVFKDYLMVNLRDNYHHLLAAAKGVDFIVAHEVVFAAPLVAEMLKIDWATGILAPGSFFSAYDPFVLPPYPFVVKFRWMGPKVNRLIRDAAKIVTRNWGDPVRQLRQELGLAPLQGNPIIDAKYSPELVLALFSAVVGAPQPDWPPHTVQTGFPVYDGGNVRSLSDELEQFLAAGAPPIVFTLGSAAVVAPGRFFQVSIEAAIRLNRRAVLLIGNNPPPELPPELIAIDYAPYSQIFPRAAAIVHQGGIGTTAQALRSGRPTLIMPYSHDQPDNAARAERLGTSVTISRENYTVDRAVKALSALLTDPSYGTRAAEIGCIVRSEDGIGLACEAIQSQLAVPARAVDRWRSLSLGESGDGKLPI